MATAAPTPQQRVVVPLMVRPMPQQRMVALLTAAAVDRMVAAVDRMVVAADRMVVANTINE